MIAPKPTYQIFYNGKDITRDILPYVLSLTYSDKAEGESDELEIIVEDLNGLWRNEWYPVKGDSLMAKIINDGQTLECGIFTIDEISGSGGSGGDTITIKALAAGIDKKMRTKNSYAHENKTLREIANTVASKNGLTVEGNIQNIRIGRITQHRQTDLHFLKKLAGEYGYSFSVRGNKLIFTNIFNLENKKPAFTVNLQQIINWSITDKTSQTFKKVEISCHSPKEKKVHSSEQTEDRSVFKNAKSDTLKLRVTAENQQQAEIKGKVALYRANSLQQQGSFETTGNPLSLAGNNCELVGIGNFSGLYYIESSTHTVNKDGGYTTSVEIKRVGLVGKEKQK